MAINNNTTKINELINAINALPEAGADTSDATATANDMAQGVTAYVNGQKITGNLPIMDNSGDVGDETNAMKPPYTFDIYDGKFSSYWFNTSGRYILENNTVAGIQFNASEFGNATAADVVSGKTFTSSTGLKVAGTFEGGAGLPNGVSKLACGADIPSSDATYLNVTHNLGVVPNFLIWFVENDLGTTGVAGIATDGSVTVKNVRMNTTASTKYNVHYVCHGYNASTAFGQTAGKYSNTTDMTATIARIRSASPYYLKAGYKYYWICGVLDNVL